MVSEILFLFSLIVSSLNPPLWWNGNYNYKIRSIYYFYFCPLSMHQRGKEIHPSVIAIRTTVLGIVVGVLLIIVKGAAGYFGHSYALIADATESGADILSSLLLWVGLRISLKAPDREHPYGHGKAEPLGAIAVALFLILAAFWIGYNAIALMNTPHHLPERFTLWVLVIVIAVKEIMYRYVHAVGERINSQAVKADARHHRSDAFTSVAAFVGISIALIGGQGFEGADDWAALLASAFIFYNAIVIIKPAIAEIMDTAPGEEIVEEVKAIAVEVVRVKAIEKCYVRKMGFDFFVDIHVEVDGELTVTEGHEIAHEVKDALLNSNLRISNVLVHVEPY